MKLHLPRVLLATIFAAFALAPSAWGGEWGTYGDSTTENAYYVGTAEDALDITAGDHSGITSLYLTPQGEVTSSTVTGVNLKTGDTLNIVGNGTTNFAGLTIGSISVKESGTATLNVETGQTATISAINGTLNTTVTGTLTLDSESNITLGTVSVGTNTNKVGKLILNSAVNVTGTLTGWGGELEIGAKDIVINHLSLGERGNAQSKILIKENANLTLNKLTYHTNNKNGINLENNAIISLNGLQFKGLSNTNVASIKRSANGGDYTLDNTNFTLSNGEVQVSAGGTLSNQLINADLVHSTDTTLNVTNAENTLTKATVSAGTVNLKAKTVNNIDITGGTLDIKNAATISGTINLGTQNSHTGKIVISDALNITGTVNAYGGSIEISAKDVQMNTFNSGLNGASRGTILIKKNASLQLTKYINHSWNGNGGIILEEDGLLTTSGLQLRGVSNRTTIDRDANGGDYSLGTGDYTITNGEAQVSGGGTLGNKLVNTSLVHSTDTTLNVTNAANSINTATVSAGTLKLNGTSANSINANGGALELNSTAANGMSVGNMNIAAGAGVSGTGAVSITQKLTLAGTEAFALTGSLSLGDGMVLDISSLAQTIVNGEETIYTLGTASSIKLGENISLSGLDLAGSKFSNCVLAVQDAPALLADEGATADGSQMLVLTLTPAAADTLSSITVSGGSYAGGVLTFTTEADLTAGLAPELNLSFTEETWQQILKQNPDMAPEISVSLQGADGLVDFTGVTKLTINGVEAIVGDGTPYITGTVAGKYVTAYIPEPASTALSMLALAALAVRRRRDSHA